GDDDAAPGPERLDDRPTERLVPGRGDDARPAAGRHRLQLGRIEPAVEDDVRPGPGRGFDPLRLRPRSGDVQPRSLLAGRVEAGPGVQQLAHALLRLEPT